MSKIYRTKALIEAQKRYYNKIKETEDYKEYIKIYQSCYYKIVYPLIKDDEEFKKKNRDNYKKYYELNKEKKKFGDIDANELAKL